MNKFSSHCAYIAKRQTKPLCLLIKNVVYERKSVGKLSFFVLNLKTIMIQQDTINSHYYLIRTVVTIY